MWIRFCVYLVILLPILYLFYKWARKAWKEAEINDKLNDMSEDVEMSTLVDDEDLEVAEEAKDKLDKIRRM